MAKRMLTAALIGITTLLSPLELIAQEQPVKEPSAQVQSASIKRQAQLRESYKKMAIADLESEASKNPNEVVYCALSAKVKDTKTAYSYAKKSLDLNSNYWPALISCSQCELEQGNLSESYRKINKAVAGITDTEYKLGGDAYYLKGRIELKMGLKNEARESLSEACQRNPQAQLFRKWLNYSRNLK